MALDALKSRLLQVKRLLPIAQPRPDATTIARPVQAPVRNVAVRAFLGEDGFDGSAGPAPIGKTPPLPTADAARRAAIDRAVETGEPQEFVNTDGETVTVQIEETGWPFDGDTRRVKVGDDEFTVKFDTEGQVDKNQQLTQLVDSFSEVPAQYRDLLDEVVITSDSRRLDTGGTAGAWADDGTITFFDNGASLSEDLFHHEMGHFIGREAENADDGFFSDWFGEPSPVPNGWEDAARSDGNYVSEYADDYHDLDGDYREDFADAWSQYLRAVDEGPAAVEAFKQQYPARYEILSGLD